MPIIRVRNNENIRWKKEKRKKQQKNKQTNKQTNKDRKEQGGTAAIVKGWQLNDFVAHLGLAYSR